MTPRETSLMGARSKFDLHFFEHFHQVPTFLIDQIVLQGPRTTATKLIKKSEKKKSPKENFPFFRIEKRGLNLMRSMQQGISTHYNTRFGI